MSMLKISNHDPGVRVIAINRPDVLNALNSEVISQLTDAMTEAGEDDGVRVIILTGEGDKAFVAGADIAEMAGKSTEEGMKFAGAGHRLGVLIDEMRKPVIAAVNGFALGGGTEMAIACDFIIASDMALFGQPEVCLGIIPGFGGTFRLARFVGLPRAKELIFSGRKIKADEALAMGLANRVVPHKDLMKEVMALATSIAKNSKSAVGTAKHLLNELVEQPGRNYKVDAEAYEFANLFGSHDQKEGMGAFVEKRKPKFEGL